VTGKGQSAGSATTDKDVQSHSLGELSRLGLAMNPPSAWVSVFSENEDCDKSLPHELLMNARPDGVSLHPTCQQHGRGQGGGSHGRGISGERQRQSWGRLQENQESRKLIQAWYRMEAQVNRAVSCAKLVWEAPCCRQGYTRRGARVKLVLPAFCSVLNHISKHLLP